MSLEYTFEWDDTKERANLRKHRVSFDEAQTVFEDLWALASTSSWFRSLSSVNTFANSLADISSMALSSTCSAFSAASE